MNLAFPQGLKPVPFKLKPVPFKLKPVPFKTADLIRGSLALRRVIRRIRIYRAPDHQYHFSKLRS